MSDRQKEILIQVSSGTIVKTILFLLLVAVLFYLQNLVLVLLTAIVLASAVEPATKWFMRYKVPRVMGVLLVYLIVAIVLFGIFYIFIPPLLNDAAGLFATFPQYIDSIIGLGLGGEGIVGSDIAARSVQSFSFQSVLNELQGAIANVSEGFIKTVSIVFGGVLSLIFIIVFSFYFAVQENGIDNFLRVVTPIKHQDYVVDLWKRSQLKIGRWMQGQLVLALIIGVLTYLGLTIFGIPYALLLAVLAALFELIPIFGPILAAIPAVAVGLVEGGATLGILVAGFYLIVQQFENHRIYPLVVKKVVGVPPLLVILALIVGAQVAGFLGIILSVPIAAAIQEFVQDIQKEKKILKETAK